MVLFSGTRIEIDKDNFLILFSPLEIRGQDMGDVMVLVDSEEEEEEEEDKGDVAEEVGQETRETEEELPREIGKHGHIHRVTALVNGNLDRMGNGLQEFQDDSDGQQSDIVEEEDKPV